MTKDYRPYSPEQDFLLPPSLREWLPGNHLAYFVSDMIDRLDLGVIEGNYKREQRGYPPYHPRMMTKVLIYGYRVGVFSSRKLKKRLVEDVIIKVLAASNEPDFRRISEFRRIHYFIAWGSSSSKRPLKFSSVPRLSIAGLHFAI
jgi:transposase